MGNPVSTHHPKKRLKPFGSPSLGRRAVRHHSVDVLPQPRCLATNTTQTIGPRPSSRLALSLCRSHLKIHSRTPCGANDTFANVISAILHPPIFFPIHIQQKKNRRRARAARSHKLLKLRRARVFVGIMHCQIKIDQQGRTKAPGCRTNYLPRVTMRKHPLQDSNLRPSAP